MKRYIKKALALTFACLLLVAAIGINVTAAETYIEAQMFDDIPDIKSITENYDLKLVDRGNGNQALKVTALEGAKAMTMSLSVAKKDYSGASYFEFFVSTSEGEGKFSVSPSVKDSQGWIGMNTAKSVLFSDGLVGRYYVKPDGGDWQFFERGDSLSLQKGFSGYIRLPIECLTRNNVTKETNVPVKLNSVTAITSWYSYLAAGDTMILDDFRFVIGDDSFYDESKDTQSLSLNKTEDSDEDYDIEALFAPIEESEPEEKAESDTDKDLSADGEASSGLVPIIVTVCVAVVILGEIAVIVVLLVRIKRFKQKK